MCAGFLYSRSRSQLNSHIKMFLVRFFYITAKRDFIDTRMLGEKCFFGVFAQGQLQELFDTAPTPVKKCQSQLMALFIFLFLLKITLFNLSVHVCAGEC